MSRFVNLEFDDASRSSRRERAPAKDEGYYWGFAQRAFEEADFEKAMRYYAKVLEFNPRNAAAWSGQVRALIELREFREARLWADKALETFPHDPETLAAKAVALGRSDAVEEALAYSDASIEARGDTPYVWLARADVFLARREKRADFCVGKALALAPGDWFTAWLASRLHFYHEQFALAFKAAQTALEANASQSVVWLQLGLCQRNLGLVGAARTSLQHARQLNPRDPETKQALLDLDRVGWRTRFAGLWRKLFRA